MLWLGTVGHCTGHASAWQIFACSLSYVAPWDLSTEPSPVQQFHEKYENVHLMCWAKSFWKKNDLENKPVTLY